jgi:hypothetical protein
MAGPVVPCGGPRGIAQPAFLRVRVRVRDLRTHVVLTNRQIPLNSIDLGETDV